MSSNEKFDGDLVPVGYHVQTEHPQVYWVVGYRWVIHYGEPAKVVNVRGVYEEELRESWEKCFIFEDNSHACRVADLFQSQKNKLTIQFN